MLTIHGAAGERDCSGLSRRAFLQVGALGCGGLTLAQWLSMKSALAAQGVATKETSVVMLFLSGGPSHIETFDPKLTAPIESRSMTGEVATNIPGITFGGTFPQLAGLADRMAVVRSFHHKTGSHPEAIKHVFNCLNPTGASLGCMATRLRGSTHPETGLPMHVHLSADEVDGQYRNERQRMLEADKPGSLGSGYQPFDPSGKGETNQNLRLNIAQERLDDRLSLKASLDRLQRDVDSGGAMEGLDKFQQQAFQLILGDSRQAFDLSREDARTLRRYDTSRFQTGHKALRRSELGRQLLLARRLCEAGCGFVTVQNPGWDMHADGNNPGIEQGMEMLGRPVDQAVSAFLEDVADRGLSDKILLVITGDFGRTPKINKRGGRDHWPNLGTLAFAGGGLKMGQAVGQSSRGAEVPAADPVTLDNLLGTVMHALFDTSQLRLQTNIPRDIAATLERAQPIASLI